MIKGLYISALGMNTETQRMDAISNNIANVNTTGYKRDLTVSRSFAEELTQRLNAKDKALAQNTFFIQADSVGKWSPGLFLDDVYTDFAGGSLQQTGAPLNLAVTGGGFFSVSARDADGNAKEMYTRDGSFTLGPDGALMTLEGHAVLGANGAVTLPAGNVTVDAGGRVYANGSYVDTLKMTDFEDYHTLRKAGDNLFDTTEGSVAANFEGAVTQGSLEASNVNSVREMTDMIAVSRAYEANSRLVTIHDTELGRAVNDIGRKSAQ
ncbi:MAG: flagellar basal-body rod protein FlgF [Defluviitaleaceae bacterium]|nr:flagellar basal-body rod protein FlgF [Defluviitaleaceae bacterium]